MGDAHKFVEQLSDAMAEGDFSKVDYYDDDGADDFDVTNVTADVIADLRRSADYGMPSGDGLSFLVLFPDGTAVTLRGVDDQADPAVEDFPDNDRDRARFLANWGDIYAPIAVLVLEPLDPDGELSQDEHARWERAMANAASYVKFEVSDSQRALVRRAFVRDAVYSRAKAALASPTSEDGRLLLGAVEFLEVGPNEFCSGQWEDVVA